MTLGINLQELREPVYRYEYVWSKLNIADSGEFV